MCEAEFVPGLASVAESLQRPPVRLQREKACVRSESSEGIVWTVPPCQGSESLMQVRCFQSARLLCLDSLCPSSSMRKEYIQDLFVWHRLGKRSDSGRDFFFFFICIVTQVCTQTHKVIQGNQGLQNTKSFLQIMAKSLYLIRCISGLLCMKFGLLSFLVSLCGLH